MEENGKLLESLLEKASEYGKTSFELAKLKALEKTTDIVSSFIPSTIVFLLIAIFFLFINLGLAFWLGDILGKSFYGFFILSAFYILAGCVIHFFLHKSIKKLTADYFIKHILR